MKLLVGIACMSLVCGKESEHAGAASVLQRAENAVKQLEDHCKNATALAANKTAIMAFEGRLKFAAAQAEASLKQRRDDLSDKLHAMQQKAQAAIQNANSFNITANITAALDVADAALAALRTVSSELQALDREERHQLSQSFQAVRKEATGLAHRLARRAERVADSVVDPLYNLGDSMEELADKLTDRRTDLADCALDALDKVDTQIHDRADEIEHKRSESLQRDADKRRDIEIHLQRQAQRAVTRNASLEAVFVMSAQNQNSGRLFGPIALTAITASACTALSVMRSRTLSSLNSPLLPQ
jgi:hypothetical protein